MGIPSISPTDLSSFHATHFSSTSTAHFSQYFLGPVEAEEADDDGLGYYADGVKRTLTDEQIAIFRHSEIQTLLRERRYAEEAREEGGGGRGGGDEERDGEGGGGGGGGGGDEERDGEGEGKDGRLSGNATTPAKALSEEGELEDGEVGDAVLPSSSSSPSGNVTAAAAAATARRQGKDPQSKKSKKVQKAKEKGWFKQQIKPDLRKRTWDKVDTGLEGLDYDEDVGRMIGPVRPVQRRRVVYGDDGGED